MPRNHPPRLTRCGTPISASWDDAWAANVEATELRLSRRICGARTIDGEPCTLFSDHPSGRCRYHGGHSLTGAPAANRNAYLHGLFVRRLRDCGPHCPRFDRCPFAGDDVVDIPASQRPFCPYELTEYELSIEDLCGQLPPNDDTARQQAHHIVLLQVLLGRAAQALLTDDRPKTLNAFLRLSGEYRRALDLLCGVIPANCSSLS
ncbi:MAG: HGGxSTG domain-containing protein [FCB group bacterium]|jgi:hypothetical protein|nr:HGGxSTG domain-containing protein [FCB group bacterium]